MQKVYLIIDDKNPGLPLAAFSDRKNAETYCLAMEKNQEIKKGYNVNSNIWYSIMEMEVISPEDF
jgi:hypothetical protein